MAWARVAALTPASGSRPTAAEVVPNCRSSGTRRAEGRYAGRQDFLLEFVLMTRELRAGFRAFKVGLAKDGNTRSYACSRSLKGSSASGWSCRGQLWTVEK